MNVQSVPGWTSISFANMVGVTEFGWDGGADQIIHGTMRRTLPDFILTGAQINPKSTARMIVVTLVADGIAPEPVTMPVRVLTDQEWSEYMKEIGLRTFFV